MPVAEQEPAAGAPGPPKVLVTVRYPDGWLSGRVEDREVRVDHRSFKLSRLRRWQRGPTERVEPDEGAAIEGKVEGLTPLVLEVAGRPRHPDLTLATDLYFEAGPELSPVPGLEELTKRRFLRPFYSVKPVTSYRAFIRGKIEERTIKSIDSGLLIHYSTSAKLNSPLNQQGGTIQLLRPHRGPKADPIETGKIYDLILGGENGAKFIVWEIEKADDFEDYLKQPNDSSTPKEGSPFKRLAIDYTYYKKGNNIGGPGMIRYNSSFK